MLYFRHSTSVLPFHTDVVLTISMEWTLKPALTILFMGVVHNCHHTPRIFDKPISTEDWHQVLGPISRTILPSTVKFDGKYVSCESIAVYHVATKLCTRHDSRPTVPCAKSHSDDFTNLKYDGNFFVKWAPAGRMPLLLSVYPFAMPITMWIHLSDRKQASTTKLSQ